MMTNEEAIITLKANYPDACFGQLREAVDAAIEALKTTDCNNLATNLQPSKQDDLISRQAALDALKQQADTMSGWSERYAEQRKGVLTAVNIVEDFPSVQPQPIVRCKGCKYWMPYDWMFSEIWRSQNINDYSEDEIGCKYCYMTMKADDFCSRAERRTDSNGRD